MQPPSVSTHPLGARHVPHPPEDRRPSPGGRGGRRRVTRSDRRPGPHRLRPSPGRIDPASDGRPVLRFARAELDGRDGPAAQGVLRHRQRRTDDDQHRDRAGRSGRTPHRRLHRRPLGTTRRAEPQPARLHPRRADQRRRSSTTRCCWRAASSSASALAASSPSAWRSWPRSSPPGTAALCSRRSTSRPAASATSRPSASSGWCSGR